MLLGQLSDDDHSNAKQIHGHFKCTMLTAVERGWPAYELGWKRIQESYKVIGTRCVFYLRDGILTSTIPPIQHWEGSSAELEETAGGRTPSSDLSTPFALTSKSLWDIADPNIATIKSRLTFENKQEYHTRWDACKLPALFFSCQFLLLLTINPGNCTLLSRSCDWLLQIREEFSQKDYKQTNQANNDTQYLGIGLRFIPHWKAGNSTMCFLCFPWCYWVGFSAVLPIIKLGLIHAQNPNPICSLQTKKQKLSSYVTPSHVFINWAAWLIAAILIQKLPKQEFSHCIFHNQFMTSSRWLRYHKISNIMCLTTRILMCISYCNPHIF